MNIERVWVVSTYNQDPSDVIADLVGDWVIYNQGDPARVPGVRPLFYGADQRLDSMQGASAQHHCGMSPASPQLSCAWARRCCCCACACQPRGHMRASCARRPLPAPLSSQVVGTKAHATHKHTTFIWECCPDKPQTCLDVEAFKAKNIPHNGSPRPPRARSSGCCVHVPPRPWLTSHVCATAITTERQRVATA